jgi:hypothetical protein
MQGYYCHLGLIGTHFKSDPKLVNEDQLREFYVYKRSKGGWAPKSCRQSLAAAKHFYRGMLGHEYASLDAIKARDRETLPTVLTVDELRRLFGCVRFNRYRVPLLLIYACGLRVNECTHLTVDDIGVDRGKEVFNHRLQRDAVGLFRDARFLLSCELTLDTSEASGQRRHGIGIAGAHDHLHCEIFKRNRRLGNQLRAGGLDSLCHADGIDNHVVCLGGFGGRRDLAQIVEIEGASAAAFHLLEVVLTFHVAHKEQAFQRFHVGASGHLDQCAGLGRLEPKFRSRHPRV